MLVESGNRLFESTQARYQSYLLADEWRQSSDDLTQFGTHVLSNRRSRIQKAILGHTRFAQWRTAMDRRTRSATAPTDEGCGFYRS